MMCQAVLALVSILPRPLVQTYWKNVDDILDVSLTGHTSCAASMHVTTVMHAKHVCCVLESKLIKV